MIECNQCGKCCIKYSDGGLCATSEEVDYWQQHRPDIARFVEDNRIWVDPVSRTQLPRCPFLTLEPKSGKYGCGIYDDRPEDCRQYPVTVDQMIIDDCEMLQPHDLLEQERAQSRLDLIMTDSRPPYGG